VRVVLFSVVSVCLFVCLSFNAITPELVTYLLLVVDGLGSSTALNAPLVAGVETLLESQHRLRFYDMR